MTEFRMAVLALLMISSCASAQTAVYTIGNSLTNDTRPQILDNSQWHIFCSKNLDYIYNNPAGHCVSSSNPWPSALTSSETFDYISVQPFEGTTLQQDRDIISVWMSLRPRARFVVHSGWTARSTFPKDYLEGNPDDTMRPTPEYMMDLVDELRALHPGRIIIQTRANDLLFSIWQDIENGIGPYDSFTQDLYRDFVHMHHDTGRYLMHNAMRYATRQPLFDLSQFPNTTQVDADYLNQKIIDVVVIRGDLNRDGEVNLLDVDEFVETISTSSFDICADCNDDGAANLLDVQSFVAILTGD